MTHTPQHTTNPKPHIGGALTCTLALLVALSAMALTATAAPALALPEGRVLEMVSPVYKGGYGANAIEALSINGESVAFSSLGAFSGAPSSPAVNGYLARRGARGWSTVPLMPPAAIAPWGLENPVDFSPTLDLSLSFTKPGANYGSTAENYEDEFLLHSSALPDNVAGFSLAGMILRSTVNGLPLTGAASFAASSDFSHIFIETGDLERLLDQAPTGKGAKGLYDMMVSGPGAPSLKLVALKDNGELIDRFCGAALGTRVGVGSTFNAVAADGVVVFFTTNANEAAGDGTCDGAEGTPEPHPENPAILYVRLAGQRTLQVSASLAADCEVTAPCHTAPQMRAEFVGADETGSRVFFATSQPLVSGDRDTANDLYMATIGCPPGKEACPAAEREVTSLTQVSRDPSAGQAAEVQGAVRMANDGSRIYYVAHGVLSSGANAEGRIPVAGADNLYVYDSANATTTFVADLCSGPETSGEARDSSCPATLTVNENDTRLWSGGGSETAGEGRFLVFESFARLAGGDSDARRDVYRYDAVTGTIDRVSLGEGGYDANGNSNSASADARLPADSSSGGNGSGPAVAGSVRNHARLGTRAVSEDGSRIIFVSAEPLSPHAINGLENLYEWHKEPGWGEGRVSLVSSGNSTEPVSDAVISPSGRDLVFVTSQSLLPQDTDGAPDVYDARLGGGFPTAPAPPQPCSSDACQGPLTNPAALLVPGSVSQAPGENLGAPPVAQIVPSASSKASAKKNKKKKRGGRSPKHHGRRTLRHRKGRR